VQGISDIITTPGLINRDFSDIKSIMTGMGYAMMGTAAATGANAALLAAEQAISCPLLEEGGVRGARGILINITGSSRLGLHEVNEACSLIRKAASYEDVQINFGVVMNESMGEEVKITVIATGFERETLPQIERRVRQAETITIETPMVMAASAGVTTNAFTSFDAEPVMMEPEPEPMIMPEPPAPQEEVDDFEMPAFLKRERRLFN
jgi:cell division protein FtsZ